jgi:hypothetical protein
VYPSNREHDSGVFVSMFGNVDVISRGIST